MFGLPLHPSVIHFPIALAVVGALAEVAYLVIRKPWIRFFGPVLLTLALLGAGGAYFSGQAAEDPAEHQGVPEKAIGAHEQAAIIALSTIAVAALLSWATRPRDRGLQLAAIVAAIAAALTIYAGHLGGRLVFVHGAGRVEQAAPPGTAPAGTAPEVGRGEHSDHEGDHD